MGTDAMGVQQVRATIKEEKHKFGLLIVIFLSMSSTNRKTWRLLTIFCLPIVAELQPIPIIFQGQPK